MSMDTEIAIMIALIPFLAVWGLLALSSRVARARSVRVARQIALTEAIHLELGWPRRRCSAAGPAAGRCRFACPCSARVWWAPSAGSPTICFAGWTGRRLRACVSS